MLNLLTLLWNYSGMVNNSERDCSNRIGFLAELINPILDLFQQGCKNKRNCSKAIKCLLYLLTLVWICSRENDYLLISLTIFWNYS